MSTTSQDVAETALMLTSLISSSWKDKETFIFILLFCLLLQLG
jgi:hypothetical protein